MIFNAVSLTLIVLDCGVGGKAEENAQSSSSLAESVGAGAGEDAVGFGFAKSNIDGDAGGAAREDDVREANGSIIGAFCLACAAACCCWNREGCGVLD